MSSEKFDRVPGENKDITQGADLMTEAELEEARAMYKVADNSTTAKAAFGAMVLGAAMAAAPDEAAAQSRERMVDSANISVESTRSLVREGVASHPELGQLNIQIFNKKIDPTNPVYTGIDRTVTINGVEQKVIATRSMRNGAAFFEMQNQDGTKSVLVFPSAAEMMSGKQATFTAKEGDAPVPIK
jgi:hypothetical protein